MGKNQEFSFRYGSEVRVISLASDPACETLLPQSLPPLNDPASAVRAAVVNPIGTPPLRKILHPGERVAVVVRSLFSIRRPMTFSFIFINIYTEWLYVICFHQYLHRPGK